MLLLRLHQSKNGEGLSPEDVKKLSAIGVFETDDVLAVGVLSPVSTTATGNILDVNIISSTPQLLSAFTTDPLGLRLESITANTMFLLEGSVTLKTTTHSFSLNTDYAINPADGSLVPLSNLSSTTTRVVLRAPSTSVVIFRGMTYEEVVV